MGRWVWAPAVLGPLAGHSTGFERWLRTRGFSGSAVSQRIWQFDHLSRWLDREGLRVDQLTPARQEQFLAARRAAGYRTWVSARSLRVPLAYLREVVPMPVPVPNGPLEPLLEDYRRYLRCERGLASIFRGAWLGRAERAGCWLVGLVVAGGCGKSPGVAAVGRAFLRPVGSFVS